MCSLEEKFQDNRQMPGYSKQCVDNIFTVIPGPQAATSFLDFLNSKHPSLDFTMETVTDNTLPFLEVNIAKNGAILGTSVYRKSANTAL